MGSKLENIYINLLAVLTVYGNASLIKTGSPLFFHLSALLFFLFYLLIFKRFLKVNYLIIVIAMLTVIGSFLNFSDEINVSNLFSFTFYLFLFSILITKHKYMLFDRVARFIHFLAICSIIIRMLLIAFPFLWSVFPVSDNVPNYGPYYNAYIFTQPVSIVLRNQSIFWEPGAWAVNQTIAYYWLIVVKKEYNLFFVYTFSILLTFSTSGIILYLIIVSYLLFYDKQFRIKYLNKFIAISFIMISLLIQVLSILGPDNFLIKSNLKKINSLIQIKPLSEYYDADDYRNKYNRWGSFDERLHTFSVAYYDAGRSPIFGKGRIEGQSKNFRQTSTIGQVLIQHGFIYLFIWLFLFYRSFIFKSFLFKTFFVFFLLYAEAYAFSTIFTFLIIFGANIKKIRLLNYSYELFNKKFLYANAQKPYV